MRIFVFFGLGFATLALEGLPCGLQDQCGMVLCPGVGRGRPKTIQMSLFGIRCLKFAASPCWFQLEHMMLMMILWTKNQSLKADSAKSARPFPIPILVIANGTAFVARKRHALQALRQSSPKLWRKPLGNKMHSQ